MSTDLESTINTPAQGLHVLQACKRWDENNRYDNPVARFEHGHWWIVTKDLDATEDENPDVVFSVVDQEGGDEVDGFGFEIC